MVAFAFVAAALALVPSQAHAAGLKAFGRIPCVPTDGVQFCQGSASTMAVSSCPAAPAPCEDAYDPTVPDTRVSSWDGTPLDANVVLPPHRSRNLPLLIIIGGYPSRKFGLATGSGFWPSVPGGMREWALRGYAVLSYSNRGQGDSCGTQASRVGQPACATAWQHLDDVRYEVRDTQWLASLLADQGIVDPRRIGVTGGSWGGGQSLELAALRDRVMLPDGKLIPWRSPRRHLPMRIAAAAPMAAWSDLTYAVLPNGHDLDYTLTPFDDHLKTLGVAKMSILGGLYAELAADSYLPPPGESPPVSEAVALVAAGWPALSRQNPLVVSAFDELTKYHSAYYLPYDEPPPPTLYANGWTDDIFPATEELRWVNRVLSVHPDAKVSMFFGDFGHQRAQSKEADYQRLKQAMIDWFAHYLQGKPVPVLRGVEALTTTCPASAPSGGPYFASSWPALHRGEVRYDSPGAQTILSMSGDPSVNEQIDPIAGPGACAAPSASDEQGTATYRFPVKGDGFTMIGSPTVTANLTPSGAGASPYPYVAAHLWDVAPDGKTQILVDRQLYRPAGPGRQVFQLYPNGWRFAPGHVAKLELAGQDAPYSRPDTVPGTIGVTDLELRLPTIDPPNCMSILGPAAPLVPPGEHLVPGVDATPPNRC